MNDRIRDLENQCWDHQTNHLDSEKFASLIIESCIKAIEPDPYDGDVAYARYNESLRRITQYFGSK